MRLRTLTTSLAFGLVGLGALVPACGSGSSLLSIEVPLEESNGDPICAFPAGERGTAECRRWHHAYCRQASKCGGMRHCDCVDNASAIACASETEAKRCADAWEAASCGEVPSGCELSDLADRAIARAACERFMAAICSRTDCTNDDPAGCEADRRKDGDCAAAVGVDPGFEECVGLLQQLPCDRVEEALPNCRGKLLVYHAK